MLQVTNRIVICPRVFSRHGHHQARRCMQFLTVVEMKRGPEVKFLAYTDSLTLKVRGFGMFIMVHLLRELLAVNMDFDVRSNCIKSCVKLALNVNISTGD